MPFMNLEEPKSDPAIILDALKSTFSVKDIRVDIDEFARFCDSLNYPPEYQMLFGGFLKEKLLEHYVSTILLNFSERDKFIDIAGSHSHYSTYVYGMGIESYKQDLIYPAGISVSEDSAVPLVGGNAAELPFRDNYFTKMTLHCSIEHFEGDDDVNFMHEAARVLQPQGKICIVPLYFGEHYHLVTDPRVYAEEKESIRFEEGIPIFTKNGYGNRHCRVYSVEEFKRRVVNPDIWDVEIFYITNLDELGSGLYCQYAALITKK